MKNSISGIQKEKCNGCKVCGDICPMHAITYDVDKNGFWYPCVDEIKCVSCGKCLGACSACCKKNDDGFVKSAYASWNRNDKIRRESTSGGIYAAFGNYVIENGGYLVGSVYSKDFKHAFHICGNTKEDLERIIGSKYFQSDTEKIYSATEKALKTGKIVLFTGAPCQVAALKNYLKHDYENLFTIDFICRGVPSPMIHKKKIELYEKNENSRVIFYRDKYDKYAWIHFGEQIKYENGKEKFISRWKDYINDCFVRKNLNVRESCYICEYKDGNNRSELTVGDFWGISGVTEKDLTEGVSALIVNNEKGNILLEIIKKENRIYTERRTLQEIINGNEAYYKSISKPENRSEFFEAVNEMGLSKAAKVFAKEKGYGKLIRRRLFEMKFRRFLPIINARKLIDWPQFIKFNFFCKQIVRKKDAFIIPCKGSKIQLAPKGKIELNACLYFNYYPCYKRAGRTSLLRVENDARLVINNDVEIAYDNTVSIDNSGSVEMGHFYTGVGASLVCKYKMIIGNNVMLGRDVCLFDSDYHSIFDIYGNRINHDKEIIIEDNVWIGARSMVLKGSVLRSGTIVSANSMVMGETEENKVFLNVREKRSVGENVIWER